MRRTRIDVGAILLIAIGLILAAGVAFTILALRSDPIDEAISEDRVINTLFIIEHDEKPLCSYLLMYYPGTRRAAVFDIPGSVGLILQRVNRVDRIDLVYESRHIEPFEQEIKGLLGVEISFSIVIDTGSLVKIVDLLEGVDIFIPSPVDIIEEGKPILFPSGVTRLDGDKAALYITYSAPEENAELGTFRRQRFFLGFIKRLGEQHEFLSIPEVSSLFQSFLRTSMNERTRSRLLGEWTGIDTDRMNIQSVGGNLREVSGQILILPYYDGNLIKEIVRQALGSLVRPMGGPEGERVYTVEVLNGTQTVGLAGRTAELLRGFGYDVITIGNADNQNYEKTLIIDRSGIEGLAQEFGDILHCRNIITESPAQDERSLDMSLQNFEYRADWTLIIGRDFNGRYVTE